MSQRGDHSPASPTARGALDLFRAGRGRAKGQPRRLATLAFALLSACAFPVDYSDTAYQCTVDARCPSGFQCIEGMCRPGSDPESTVAATATRDGGSDAGASDPGSPGASASVDPGSDDGVPPLSGQDADIADPPEADAGAGPGHGSGKSDAGTGPGMGDPDAGTGEPDAGTDPGTVEPDAGSDASTPPVDSGTGQPPIGPRLNMTRLTFLTSEKVSVGYVDVLKVGKPFIGIYVSFSSSAIETHDVKFGKDVEFATGSHEFRELAAGTYEVRLAYDDGTIADRITIQVLSDRDKDGVADNQDGCPDDKYKTSPGSCGCGHEERDGDGDGAPDCVDGCPTDYNKSAPGMCGCGFLDSQLDQDSDGVTDCFDGCPGDPQKIAPLQCGCGKVETDSDRDGTADCKDQCPSDPNKDKKGKCGCGQPDTDSDGDGTPNCIDQCPSDPNKTSPGLCGCGSRDNLFCL